MPEGHATVDFREILSIYGAEAATGQVQTSGSVPCRLKISGTVEQNLSSPYNLVLFNHGVQIAPLAVGAPLDDSPGVDPVDPSAVLASLPIELYGWADPADETHWPAGTTSIERYSEPFDLPLGGNVVLFQGGAGGNTRELYVRVDQGYASGSAAVDLTYSLVPVDPGLKLLFSK